MNARKMPPAERAQLAMMLEVTAFPKPGNVDRCHDYPDTVLEHFLASIIFARHSLEMATAPGARVGDVIYDAVERTGIHKGGNTHFGTFILLVPLVMGGDIPGAGRVVRATTVEDAVTFYKAFGRTQVRVLSSDPLDIHDPSAPERIRTQGLTLYGIMEHSRENDMVAREWTNGFARTRRGADLLKSHGCGRESIVRTFIDLLAEEPDTFVVKKHGVTVADTVVKKAREVREGARDLAEFDRECIGKGINPGSTADIIIASLYVALGEGWKWDC